MSKFGFLRNKRWLLTLAIVLAAGGGTAFYLASKPAGNGVNYVEQAVKRGDLSVKVTATGNLQPTNTVEVGSELSGTVAKVLVDYNDRVTKGQILVVLDTSKLQQAIDRARAALQAKQAAVAQAQATTREAEATLKRQQEVFRLSGGKVPSATELDTARAAVDRAHADLNSAQANVTEAASTLKSSETDLSKATIRSPINGVVLKRSIDPGQTVAASLSAPVLFTIAEDLSEMELIATVSEADVGQVHEGQSAQFTVDAFPSKNYPASIKQVRFGSTTVDNVVSYQTVLTAKNSDLSLRPGMTANAEILVNERKDVLLVPNSALRFKPGETGSKSSGGILSFLMPRPPGPGGAAPRASRSDKASESANAGDKAGRASSVDKEDSGMGRGTVWIKSDQGALKAVKVRTGASDGKFTEIKSRELKSGDLVITNTAVSKS